ncbi:MAG: hypothetical protein P8L85_16145 [Rubripirellula sp.]|nr:hypothetical protein [Rubripirellula sp.]
MMGSPFSGPADEVFSLVYSQLFRVARSLVLRLSVSLAELMAECIHVEHDRALMLLYARTPVKTLMPSCLGTTSNWTAGFEWTLNPYFDLDAVLKIGFVRIGVPAVKADSGSGARHRVFSETNLMSRPK